MPDLRTSSISESNNFTRRSYALWLVLPILTACQAAVSRPEAREELQIPVERVPPPQRADLDPLLPIVQGESYVGVIIPTDDQISDTELEKINTSEYWSSRFVGVRVAGFWTPDAKMIAALESNLKSVLERRVQDSESIRVTIEARGAEQEVVVCNLEFILAHIPEYRRQYLGLVTEGGSRRVFVSFIMPQDPRLVDPNAWRRGHTWQFDGGPRTWRIQFDADTGEYSNLDVNGGL